MCSRFCLVWTLLLCIWKTDGFAWLYVCVSLNLVTCVFLFNHTLIRKQILLLLFTPTLTWCNTTGIRCSTNKA